MSGAARTTVAALAVTVRLHGPAAEQAHAREVLVALPAAADTDALWDALVAQCPALAPWRAHSVLAIDNEWVRTVTALRDGAVVDVIPPVSGG